MWLFTEVKRPDDTSLEVSRNPIRVERGKIWKFKCSNNATRTCHFETKFSRNWKENGICKCDIELKLEDETMQRQAWVSKHVKQKYFWPYEYGVETTLIKV